MLHKSTLFLVSYQGTGPTACTLPYVPAGPTRSYRLSFILISMLLIVRNCWGWTPGAWNIAVHTVRPCSVAQLVGHRVSWYYITQQSRAPRRARLRAGLCFRRVPKPRLRWYAQEPFKWSADSSMLRSSILRENVVSSSFSFTNPPEDENEIRRRPFCS